MNKAGAKRTPEQYEKHISRLKETIKRLETSDMYEGQVKHQAWRERDTAKLRLAEEQRLTSNIAKENKKAQERIEVLESEVRLQTSIKEQTVSLLHTSKGETAGAGVAFDKLLDRLIGLAFPVTFEKGTD